MVKIRETEIEKQEYLYYDVKATRSRCFWCKKKPKELREMKEEKQEMDDIVDDSDDEIENDEVLIHKILWHHVIYWFHHSFLLDHLTYRCCNHAKCLNKHYNIIDINVTNIDIQEQLKQGSDTKLKYYIFENQKYRTLMRSNQMRIMHNQYTKRLNLSLFHKLDMDYFDLTNDECKAYFRLTKKQLFAQYLVIYNNFHVFMQIYQNNTHTTLHKIEIHDKKLDKKVTLYNNQQYLFKCLLVFIFNLSNPNRVKNRWILGVSFATMYKYYWAGIIFQYYFYDFSEVYWGKTDIAQHVLPEMEYIYVYVFYIYIIILLQYYYNIITIVI